MNISVREKHTARHHYGASGTGVVTSYRVGKGYTLYVRTCNCQTGCVYIYVFVPLTRYGVASSGLGHRDDEKGIVSWYAHAWC